MKPAPVQEGEIIAGKYRVERVLGAGGMGVVVAAEHLQLRERVAIKFLLPEALSSTEVIGRFLREAQAAAKIKSEHVARVLDVATLDNGLPYIVMELLHGKDLSQLLSMRGPLPVEEAVGYMLQAFEGVAEAHAVGIIHRDLKPSNIFLAERSGGRVVVKVLDFGISKVLDDGSSAPGEMALTKSTTIIGSPLYMSPEQMASAKNVDARGDIWSLGASLFELVKGVTPFSGNTITEVVTNVLHRPLPDLGSLPEGLRVALSRSMEKERERRYRDLAEFAAAIAPLGPRNSAANVERIKAALGVESLDDTALAFPAPVATPIHAAPAQFVGGSTTQPLSASTAENRNRSRKTSGFRIVAGAGVSLLVVVGLVTAVSRSGLLHHSTQIVPDGDAPPSATTIPLTTASNSSTHPDSTPPPASSNSIDAASSAMTPPISSGPRPRPTATQRPPASDPWDKRR